MNVLVIRALEGHVAAPLIGDHIVVHHASHDTQHLRVEEEFSSKARWIEGHREKVAMRATARLLAVSFEVGLENRRKGVPAGLDKARSKMLPEHAEAVFPEFDDL